jgi:hypothetical protein
VALLQDGQVLQRLSRTHQEADATGDELPVLLSVEPPCICGSSSPSFSLLGRGLQSSELEVVCRSAGRHLYPAVQQHQLPEAGGEGKQQHEGRVPGGAIVQGGARAGLPNLLQAAVEPQGAAAVGHPGLECIGCQLPPLQGCHFVMVEVCHQGYLSAALPLLVLEDARLVAELASSLSSLPSLPSTQREALLRDVAAALQPQEPSESARALAQAATCRVLAFAQAAGCLQLADSVLLLADTGPSARS